MVIKNPTERDYWTKLIRLPLTLNFWMSEEYVEKAELKFAYRKDEQSGNELVGYADPADPAGWFFAPMDIMSGLFEMNANIYAGFPGFTTEGAVMETLDQQYIYNPHRFDIMEGGCWSTFRRNVRKYPKRNPGELVYRRLEPQECEDEIAEMLTQWTSDGKVYDPEVMIAYFFHGENRMGLFRDGKLVGVNIYDENRMYTNFRYCLDDGTPFLNEYLRLQFYKHIDRKKMVNDGGDLGREELKRFKQKLNPLEVMPVWSHRKLIVKDKEEEEEEDGKE